MWANIEKRVMYNVPVFIGALSGVAFAFGSTFLGTILFVFGAVLQGIAVGDYEGDAKD